MESMNFEISEEEKDEIEKLYRIIHSNKIKLSETEVPISKLLEKENFIVTEHILMFIQSMTKNYSITKNEIAATAKSLDVDNNNFISEGTFIRAMIKWIKSSCFYTGLYRNNLTLLCGLNERKIFHYSLATFFVQNMNNEINDQFYSLLGGFQEILDLDFIDFEQNLNKTAEEKIGLINQSLELLKIQGSLISYELNQEDTKYEALTKIYDMIKIITISRKQNELKLVSQLILDIVMFIFGNAIINIVKIIMDDNNNYCLESLKIVSSIISTNVIQNDIYTLLNCFQNIPTSQILFNIELIQRFIDLTASVLTPQEVKSQAICCLGLYCKFHDVTAIFILNQGIIDLFWSMVIENDISGVLEKISWFFAILAAVQIPKNIVSVHYQHIERLLGIGMRFIKFNNEFVIRNGIHILRGLLPFSKMDLDVSFYIHGLMECVKWNNINITKSILVAFRDMINSNNDILIKEILRKDLFHLIINILNTDSNFILIILNIIKQLALKQYFLEIFDSSKQTIIFLLKTLNDSSVAKSHAIKIFKIIVLNAPNMFIGLLVDQGIIKIIFNAMLNFRELDELFQILYNHKDFILNFAFFEDCLTILMIILDKGNSFGGAINQFIKYFDGECLEKLKMSLNLLFENTKEIKIFLKKLITYQNRSISMGKFIYYFMEIIEKNHIINNNNNFDDRSRAYAEIKNIFAYKLFEISPEEDLEDLKSTLQLKIKCYSIEGYPRGINFEFSVLKSLKFSDLRRMIQIKYDYDGIFFLHFEDDITHERKILDDEQSYSRVVLETLKNNKEFTIKIIFQPIQKVNYQSYSSPGYSSGYNPMKNSYELRSCEICYKTSTVPYNPLNKGKSFICENCRRIAVNNPPNPQNLPYRQLAGFYSPVRQSQIGKQKYLLYDP